MAWVTLPAMTVSFVYRDQTGSSSRSQVHVPIDTTLEDANTAAAGLVATLLATSDATILSYGITYNVMNTTPAAPGANSRVENKGLFSFRTAAGKMARISVPAIKPAAVLPSGGINSTEASVQALITALLAAPWTDSNGSSLDAIVADAQVFRSTSKRQYTTDRSPSS